MIWLIVLLVIVLLGVGFVGGWMFCAGCLVTARREVEQAAAAVAVDRAGLEARQSLLMNAGDAFLAIRRATDLAP